MGNGDGALLRMLQQQEKVMDQFQVLMKDKIMDQLELMLKDKDME